MLESVYMCNLEGKEHAKAMEIMMKQFGIDVFYLDCGDVPMQEIISGYYNKKGKLNFNDEMLIFHDFLDEQIELLLDVFEQAEIPYIKHKVITTDTNLRFTVNELYEKVNEEYKAKFE